MHLDLGRKPSRQEIATEMGVDVQKIAQLKYSLRSCTYTSIDDVAKNQNTGPFHSELYVKDIVPDKELRPDEYQEHSFVHSEIISSLSSLTRQEIDTMKLRWGLDQPPELLGGERKKLEVVAESWVNTYVLSEAVNTFSVLV